MTELLTHKAITIPPSVNTFLPLNSIETLDLEPIKYKLVREKGWSLDDADRVALEYKAFLQLHLLYPEGMHVPTEDIDEMWHAHILDTGKYMVDCYRLFGHYLHHYPYLGMKDEGDAERAKALFRQTRERLVGTGLVPNDGDLVNFADCGSSCGSSCGGHGCSSHSCASGHGDSGGHGDTGGHHTPSDRPSLPFPSASCSSSDPGQRKEKPKEQGKRSWWPWKRNPTPAPKLGLWSDTVNPLILDGGNRPGRSDLEAYLQSKEHVAYIHSVN